MGTVSNKLQDDSHHIVPIINEFSAQASLQLSGMYPVISET